MPNPFYERFKDASPSPETTRAIFAALLGVDKDTYVIRPGDMERAYYTLRATNIGVSSWQEAKQIIESDPLIENAWYANTDIGRFESSFNGKTLAQIPFTNTNFNDSLLFFAKQSMSLQDSAFRALFPAWAIIGDGASTVVDATQTIFSLGGFLSILFSMQGLALIGGAILLYIGFKYVMNANATNGA